MHEVPEDADLRRARGAHNDEPEVELGFGPVILSPPLDHADYLCRHCGWVVAVKYGGVWRWEGEQGGRRSSAGRRRMKDVFVEFARWICRPLGWGDGAWGKRCALVRSSFVGGVGGVDVMRYWSIVCVPLHQDPETQSPLSRCGPYSQSQLEVCELKPNLALMQWARV